MKKTILGSCPICNKPLKVTKLECNACKTSINGSFEICKFCQLDPENQYFLEVFIKCRGNIKEVEHELGISYPTVRSRLDRIIKELGYEVDEPKHEPVDKMAILQELKNKTISVEDAIRKLRGE
jgi:hypothetical protein